MDTYFDNPSGDGKTFTKYAIDKKTVLDLTDDAARQNWGSTWRMPTDAEWTALCNTANFDWDWDDVRKGYKVTSKVSGYVGNSIFLPAAGFWYPGPIFRGRWGYYWSSSLTEEDSSLAWCVTIDSEKAMIEDGGYPRCRGISIRPVSE